MWFYQGFPFDPDVIDKEGYIGFVYLITNLTTKRKYIGKKLFTKSKTRQVKGKKKKSRVKSDWETYFGSNDELLKDVALYGAPHFSREILYLCKSKGECSYYEAYEQFMRHAIPNSEYYNVWLSVRVRKSHLKDMEIRNAKSSCSSCDCDSGCCRNDYESL